MITEVATAYGVKQAKGDQLGNMLITPHQAALQEASNRGNVFAVCNQTGVTSQAGISVTTPVLTLYNPLGSQRNLVVWYVSATFLAAFVAASAILVCVGSDVQQAAVTGTLTTAHRNLKVGLTANPSARTFLAATLPVAPVAVGVLGAGLTGEITTVPYSTPLERWYNGALILTPGTNLSIQTSTASGASGMLCGYIWEEVPVI